MLNKISIKNFKSVLDHNIELGRVNIFIGENGSGKTNILEAVATAAAALEDRMSIEDLYMRGIRVARPSLTISSFSRVPRTSAITLTLSTEGSTEPPLTIKISPQDSGPALWSISISDFQTRELQKLMTELTEIVSMSLPDEDILERLKTFDKFAKKDRSINEFCIYNLNSLALRGLQNSSLRTPLGINGENLDMLLTSFTTEQLHELARYGRIIPWFDKFFIDPEDELKLKGYKLGRSTSKIYFQDRFMRRGNNIFSAENANEGILHILFYLALFISDKTPPNFGIDNIETALNPQLCRELMKALASLAKTHSKQALITTHNPAILDGLNLHDDDQRLFVVYRNDQGHTVTKRIKLKPDTGETKFKLSELWMRGHLGGLPKTF
jgi:energy-coupling factor transporter ATP-binding protein EcfA2